MKVWLIAAFFVAGAISVSASDNFADSASHFNLIDSTSASPHARFSSLLDDSGSTGWPTGDIYATGDFMPTYCGSGVWSGIRKTVWQNGYVYCSARNGLLVLDVHDPEWPKLAAQLYLPGGRATDVVVNGNLAYIASNGDTSTGVWQSYFRVIDISDPHYPEVIGELPMASPAFSISLNGNYAYLGGILKVYTADISNPAVLRIVDTDSIPSPNLRSVTTVASGNRLYAGCWDLHIFDIADPADPQLVSTFDSPGYPSNLYVRDTILFTGNQAEVFIFEDPWSGLSAINVADPQNPRLCFQRTFRGAKGSVIGFNDMIAVGTSNGIYWFDIAEGDSLVQVAHYPTGATLSTDNTYIYAGNSFGLQTVQLSDENVPEAIGTWENPILPYAVAVSGDWVYAVSEDQTRLATAFLSPRGDITLVDTTGLPAFSYDVIASDQLLIVTTRGGGIVIFDRSNPSRPAHLATFPLADYTWTAAVAGNRVYVATANHGLVILDISDPSNPVKTNEFLAPVQATDVVVSDDTLYTLVSGYGLVIADLSNPDSPAPINSEPNDFYGAGLFIEDNIAYIDRSGVTAVDVSNPMEPVLLGQFVKVGNKYGFVLLPHRKQVAIAHFTEGVVFIDVSDPANIHFSGQYETPGISFGVTATDDHLFVCDYRSVIRLCLPLPTDIPIVDDTVQVLPTTFGLMPCYPNPFNSETTIPFTLERSSDISITIYNVLGERVRTVFNGRASAGINSAHWDGTTDNGTAVASGMYVVVLETADQRSSRRVLLIT